MRWRGWARLTGLAGLLLLQLWPYPSVSNPPEHDLVPFPPQIKIWMKEKCFDCHSNQTSWPWYSYVAPFSWLVARDVRLGRVGFNFSSWSQYSPRQRTLGLRRSLQRIQEGQMPPQQYTWMHPGAIVEAEEVRALEAYIKERERVSTEDLSTEELLAWPSRSLPSSGENLRGVFRAEGRIDRHLVLQGAVVLARGDLVVGQGLSGQGAILASGKLSIEGLQGKVGPLGLVGLEGIRLQGSPESVVVGMLHSPQGMRVEGPQVDRQEHFSLPLAGVREIHMEFCRDDGELGERNERQAIIRYAHGQFVVWDPEFQTVHRAAGLEEALGASERTIKNDPATSATRWKRRFRKQWKKELQRLTKSGPPAILQLRLTL